MSKEYDEGDDPLEEAGFGQGSNNNDYAFAKNNNSEFFTKETPYQRPLKTSVDDEFSPPEGEEEDRQLVVFLTIEDKSSGDIVDYQREYFGNRRDAQNFINSMKNDESQTDVQKQYDGFIVPVDKEKEAEEQINKLINSGGDEGERELPQAVDSQGAYWAERSKKRVIRLNTNEDYHNIRMTVNGVRCRLVEDQ